jgi:predicted AlkP superfamily pyrophosphatase or phosphodiesterase
VAFFQGHFSYGYTHRCLTLIKFIRLKKIALFILSLTFLNSCVKKQSTVQRPKIVIGLVVDQMRWDYLYRYYNLYGNGGFRRLLKEGYNCQNTSVNYLPANTAPGHSCIYTGSVPSITGISGNNWIDNQTGTNCYCVDDSKVHLVGDETKATSMSPAALLTTTITDELRLATNLKSRVYGVAIKDRGSILPAGHLANAAYWYNDKTGNFTTSTYYANQNPGWLKAFNQRKAGDSLVKSGWKLLYNFDQYGQSAVDANNYEKAYPGEKAPVFPHLFDTLVEADRYSVLKSIPAGNTYSIMMAKACLEGEKLGMGADADFLALSLSATDYIGHQFGPNSIEIEDCYLRLDQELAAFLNYLDHRYGKDGYLFFLTADHGGAHNASYLSDLDIPAGVFYINVAADLNSYLKQQFGADSIVNGILNYQVFLNNSLIAHANLDRDKIKQLICAWMNKRPEVSYAIDMENMERTPVPEPIHNMAINGFNKIRSGVIQIILNPGWYDNGGKQTGTTHGSWNPYDTHIPLIWLGWHIPKGATNRPINMTDISPTIAALLHIQSPNGCVGTPILEITDEKKFL